jgi:hypothetical protein
MTRDQLRAENRRLRDALERVEGLGLSSREGPEFRGYNSGIRTAQAIARDALDLRHTLAIAKDQAA